MPPTKPLPSTPPTPLTMTRPTEKLYTVLGAYRDRVLATSPKATFRNGTRNRMAELKRRMRNVTVGADPAVLLDEVARFVVNRRAAGWADSTINLSLSALKAALNYHAERHLGFLFPRIRRLPTSRVRVEILRTGEFARLLDAAGPRGESRTRAVLAIAGYAGLRDEEIHWLKMSDVSLLGSEPWILVTPKTAKARYGVTETWSPKNYQSRGVPVCARLKAELEPYFHAQGLTPGLDQWMFTIPAGRGRTRRRRCSSSDEVRAAFQAAGLYDRSRRPGLHMLRRTFASELLAGGVDIETVRDLLGHSEITTTQVYLGTTDRRRRDALKVMDR